MTAFTDDNELIIQIRKGNTSAFRQVYSKYFNMVRYLVIKNSGTEEDASDIFQETVTVLYEKTMEGLELNCTIKTWLYAVARNLWFKQLRSKKGEKVDFTDFEERIEDATFIVEEESPTERQLTILEHGLSQLGERCKRLLMKFYYFKRKMSDIANDMGYRNEAHAKSQKYKCMQQLKKIANG